MHLHTSWLEAEEEEETPETLLEFLGEGEGYIRDEGEPQLANNTHPGMLEASGANVDLQSACMVSGKHLVSRSIWDRSPFSLTESLLKSGPNYLLTAMWLHDTSWPSPLLSDNKVTHPLASWVLCSCFP